MSTKAAAYGPRGASIVAAYGISALGAGELAYGVGAIGERAVVAITDDEVGRAEGLRRPRAARVTWPRTGHRDRATELLIAALRGCMAELDEKRPAWRQERVGLVVGTSSGAMESAQALFGKLAAGDPISRVEARGATYFAPLEQAIAELGVAFCPIVQVLGACASSTLATGLGVRWLELGRCSVVIAAGYDALTSFVTSGFESLAATTATFPRPFRLQRDGMALGEGAVAIALVARMVEPDARGLLALEPSRGTPLVRGHVLGFGVSTDALHLTAPDRTGRGLARAARIALADAAPSVHAKTIDLVSAHATATPFNDAAEARALELALEGAAPRAVHPLKAQIGHTLGAAGLLEAMAVVESMRRRLAPAAAGEGELDPVCAVPLLDRNVRFDSRAALKLSSAFGGANAALVLAPPWQPASEGCTGPRRGPVDVHLRAHASVASADASAIDAVLMARHPHPHRPDALARLVIAAAHALGIEHRGGRTTGLIVGHTTATLEQNYAFETRRRARGARLVEARRFPATSPNAAVGECAIALGLEGPTFSVGASLHGGLEALAVARDLIAAGDADAMLVVCVHVPGPASSALLAAAEASPITEGASSAYLHLERGADGIRLPPGLPSAFDSGQALGWSGVTGPAELSAYLGALRSGAC